MVMGRGVSRACAVGGVGCALAWSGWAPVAGLAVAVACACFVLLCVWHDAPRPKGAPPVARDEQGWFGLGLEAAVRRDPAGTLQRMRAKYGPVFSHRTPLGGYRTWFLGPDGERK